MGVSRLEETTLHVGIGQHSTRGKELLLAKAVARPKEHQISSDGHTFAQDSPGRHIGGKISTLIFIDQLCGACYVFPLGLGCPSCSRNKGDHTVFP